MKHLVFAGWLWPVVLPGLFALCFACQSDPASATANLIPDEKMARILADLNIAEAATARLNGYSKDSLMQLYFRQVMEMHSVSQDTYETQLRAIATDPLRMETLLKNSEILLEDAVGEKTEGGK